MADRTVSARLRADVTAYIAAMRAAAAATRQLGDEVQRVGRRSRDNFGEGEESSNQLERALARLLQTERRYQEQQEENNRQRRRSTEETERQSQSQERLGRTTSTATRGLTAQRTTLISLIGAATAAGAGAAGAGAAFAGFGAVAAPSILKVVTAQQDLVAGWSSLSMLQRVSSVQTRSLVSDFRQLAKSYEPEALAVYNRAIATTRGLLPEVNNLVGQTSQSVLGLTNRFADFVDTRVGGEFITWAGQTAPRAMNVLGDTMSTAGDTALDLVQDIAPLGVTLLQLTNGALSAVNAVAAVNPAVAQLAISAVLLRAPILGAVSGISNFTARARQYSTATRGASLATRALGLASAAGPALYVAAGAALLYLAVQTSKANDNIDGMVSRLRLETKAFGNNLAAQEAFAQVLRKQADAANEAAYANQQQSTAVGEVTGSSVGAWEKLEAVYNKQLRAVENIKVGQRALAAEFKISEESANRLATAAGIDLSQGILKSGELTDQARQKISTYRMAVEQASDKNRVLKLALEQAADATLTLKDRVSGLTAAYDAQLNPGLAVYQTTLSLREGMRRFGEQLGNTKASMTGTNAASLQLQQTFAQQIATVRDLHAQTFQQTGSTKAANAAVARYIPILYALAGGSTAAKQQVDNLARALGFKSHQLAISKNAFITQATAMLGSKDRAVELWSAYQRLTGVTNSGSTAVGTYISRLTEQAETARKAQIRTGAGESAQRVYNQRIRDALPVLYAMAGRGSEARRQVDLLAASAGIAGRQVSGSKTAFMKAADAMGIARERAEKLWKELLRIKSREAHIRIWADGEWSGGPRALKNGPAHLRPGRAMGGPIPAAWALGPGGPTSDDVPTWLSVGEHVITAREVQAAGGHDAIYRMRAAILNGGMPGYAKGGRVSFSGDRRSTASVVGDVTAPVYDGINATMVAVAQTMASIWKQYAGQGGPIVAAARRWLGTPYSWGGGGKGGPSRGIGRGAGTVGFDCSGLTEYAWWAGRGVDIGGVTYSQHPNSVPIGSPRPGALGFNASLGHVVLASNRPGYVIEAPYTGAHVREVRKSMPDWRWPRAAMAAGGEVTPAEETLGRRFVDARRASGILIEAKTLQIAGDPGGLGLPGYAAGGGVENHIAQISPRGGPLRLWAEPETGGEAYIPLASSKRSRSVAVLQQVARQFGLTVTRMADGGVLGGDTTTDLNLSDLLQRWTDTMRPATATDVATAKANRKTQADQAAAAKRALSRAIRDRNDRIRKAERRLASARRSGSKSRIADAKEDLAKAKRTDKIRDAERKLRKEREDLNKATAALKDTERRAALGRQSPATQLGSALDLGIKNTGAFISNLTKLADRGFGTLARQLLNMGGPEAEKLAADAVKLSDSKLKGLQDKLGVAERQQETLKNLPNILTARSALRSLGANAGSWQALLAATGLPPGDLAAAVKLMAGDLAKTSSGQALLADMKRHGYRRGGWIGGPGGIDNVPIMATSGEFVINRRSALRHAPLVEAINSDRIGDALVRRYARGGWIGGAPGSGGGAGGAQVTQNFYDMPFSPGQMAREAAREAAWALG